MVRGILEKAFDKFRATWYSPRNTAKVSKMVTLLGKIKQMGGPCLIQFSVVHHYLS